jgi:hypothetical protein
MHQNFGGLRGMENMARMFISNPTQLQQMDTLKREIGELKISVPACWDELCSRRVLVMDYCSGHSLKDMFDRAAWSNATSGSSNGNSNTNGGNNGSNNNSSNNGSTSGENTGLAAGNQTSAKLILLFFWVIVPFCGRGLLTKGICHGDPHPGNFRLDEDSKELWILDWGALIELSDLQRTLLCKIVIAVCKLRNMLKFGVEVESGGPGTEAGNGNASNNPNSTSLYPDLDPATAPASSTAIVARNPALDALQNALHLDEIHLAEDADVDEIAEVQADLGDLMRQILSSGGGSVPGSVTGGPGAVGSNRNNNGRSNNVRSASELRTNAFLSSCAMAMFDPNLENASQNLNALNEGSWNLDDLLGGDGGNANAPGNSNDGTGSRNSNGASPTIWDTISNRPPRNQQQRSVLQSPFPEVIRMLAILVGILAGLERKGLGDDHNIDSSVWIAELWLPFAKEGVGAQ